MDGTEFARAIGPIMYWLGIISVFSVAPVIVVLAFLRFRARERERLYDLLKHLQDNNQPLSPDLIRHITVGPPPTREKDTRRGMLMLAAGVGLAAAYATTVVLSWGPRGAGDTPEEMAILVIAAGLLGCMGRVYLMLGRGQPRD